MNLLIIIFGVVFVLGFSLAMTYLIIKAIEERQQQNREASIKAATREPIKEYYSPKIKEVKPEISFYGVNKVHSTPINKGFDASRYNQNPKSEQEVKQNSNEPDLTTNILLLQAIEDSSKPNYHQDPIYEVMPSPPIEYHHHTNHSPNFHQPDPSPSISSPASDCGSDPGSSYSSGDFGSSYSDSSCGSGDCGF